MSSNDRIAKMKEAREVISSFDFKVVPLDKGYANRWLRVDVGSGEITINPVDDEMKRLWTGGKGFDLWMTFQEIDKDTKWDSPNNPICFSSGPLGGSTSFPGSGKTIVTAISPLTHSMIDCNVGGYFGPYLKFAGFDSMMVTGKVDEDVIVFIDAVAGRVTIEKAPLESVDSHLIAEELAEMYADDELDLRNIAVRIGRPRRGTHPHGDPQLLLLGLAPWRPEAQAGGTRRYRNGVARQEDQGCRDKEQPGHAGMEDRGEQGREDDHSEEDLDPVQGRGRRAPRDHRPLELRSGVRHRDDAGYPGALPPYLEDRYRRDQPQDGQAEGAPLPYRDILQGLLPRSRRARRSSRSAWERPATSRARRRYSTRSSGCSASAPARLRLTTGSPSKRWPASAPAR